MNDKNVILFKSCEVNGCDRQIRASYRINVCSVHQHNEICNCMRCFKERKREKIVKEREEKSVTKKISLVPAPWDNYA